jgi:lysyl endopeptidase
MKKILLFFLIICACKSYSQVLTKVVNPTEIEARTTFSYSSKAPRVTMPPVDLVKLLEQEDIECKDCPLRFGYGIKTDIDLDNSGTWSHLPNGDKIWSLKISSPGAYSINLRFDMFYLANGAELYIYNKDRTMIQGPYTSDLYSGIGEQGELLSPK